MSESTQQTRAASEKRRKKEREEKFFSLVDRTQTMIEEAMEEEECGIKDLKQITGVLKDLKDLLFDKGERSGADNEKMLIKIEGDVEECSP